MKGYMEKVALNFLFWPTTIFFMFLEPKTFSRHIHFPLPVQSQIQLSFRNLYFCEGNKVQIGYPEDQSGRNIFFSRHPKKILSPSKKNF